MSKKKRKSEEIDELKDDVIDTSDDEIENEDVESEEESEESEDDTEEYYDDEDDFGFGAPKKKKKKNKKKKKQKEVEKKQINIVKELLYLIVYIGAIVLLCFFIITFVGSRAKVDGSSMNPTLDNNDSVWVDKLSYRIGSPKRFDIIIFNYDENTTYVKRIIGLPGEKVRIDQEGNIYINDEILEENYGKEKILPSKVGRACQTILLGSDEYFVLGDNRNNSSDSRYADVGNIKMEDIVGKVRLRIAPFKSFGFVK